MTRHPSNDNKVEHNNQVWKKISDAAEKELGTVPRELVTRWEFHTGRTAAGNYNDNDNNKDN